MRYSADKLRHHITSQGRRAHWVADQLGLHRTTIYRFMDGSRAISPEIAEQLANVLGIDVSELEDEEAVVRVA